MSSSPGEKACPNCKFSYDQHGLGGNCPTRNGARLKPKPKKNNIA